LASDPWKYVLGPGSACNTAGAGAFAAAKKGRDVRAGVKEKEKREGMKRRRERGMNYLRSLYTLTIIYR